MPRTIYSNARALESLRFTDVVTCAAEQLPGSTLGWIVHFPRLLWRFQPASFGHFNSVGKQALAPAPVLLRSASVSPLFARSVPWRALDDEHSRLIPSRRLGQPGSERRAWFECLDVRWGCLFFEVLVAASERAQTTVRKPVRPKLFPCLARL